MKLIGPVLLVSLAMGCRNRTEEVAVIQPSTSPTGDPYKDKLTAEQYRVLRQKGTERAFSGKYDQFTGTGTYSCGACGAELFSSETKYDSGCGWPSYWDALPGAVKTHNDHGSVEAVCAKCDSHLGHIFSDGPKPTGLRY